MITSLTLRAFKSFKDETTFPIAPLTVISGVNSSGKSSIIQAIRILDNVAAGKSVDDAIPEGHGSIGELKNKASKPDELKIIVSAANAGSFGISANNLVAKDAGVIPENLFISADRFGSRTTIAVYNHDRLDPRGDNMLKVLRRLEDMEIPEAARHKDAEKYNFLPNLEAWLNEISTGVKFRYEIADRADQSYTLFNDFRSTNVGFGLSYTLPVIISLLWATLKPGRLVMLENPEAHLHPKGQSKMAELICRVVEAGAQVILETHSDHIINGIRVNARRFEEDRGGIDRSKVGIIHVIQNPETHESRFEPVVIEEGGRIYDAPADFFDQFAIDRRELLGF